MYIYISVYIYVCVSANTHLYIGIYLYWHVGRCADPSADSSRVFGIVLVTDNRICGMTIDNTFIFPSGNWFHQTRLENPDEGRF